VETTKNIYGNPRVLHQPGAKPQVSMSQWGLNGVPRLPIAAVWSGTFLEPSLLMQDPSAGRSRLPEGSPQAHRGREGVAWLDSIVPVGHSDSWNTRLRHYTYSPRTGPTCSRP